MKVKDIKKKVAAKVAKGRAKVARKCGKGKACAAAALAALAVFGVAAALAGCQGLTSPSRSQSLSIRDCTINIYGGGAETNEVARVEIASQAMSIENSGTESQTSSPTQTNDIKPDVDVDVGGAGGLVESVAGICSGGGKSGAGNGAAASCPGGACEL